MSKYNFDLCDLDKLKVGDKVLLGNNAKGTVERIIKLCDFNGYNYHIFFKDSLVYNKKDGIFFRNGSFGTDGELDIEEILNEQV